jgi:chaperonin GroES
LNLLFAAHEDTDSKGFLDVEKLLFLWIEIQNFPNYAILEKSYPHLHNNTPSSFVKVTLSTHEIRVLIPYIVHYFNTIFHLLEVRMNLTPLHDRVLVRPSKPEEVTAGGIIIPDTAKEKPMQGEVIAVGPGKVNDDGKVSALQVKVGDAVLYGKYSGTEVSVNGEELLIMRESDIFAVLTK